MSIRIKVAILALFSFSLMAEGQSIRTKTLMREGVFGTSASTTNSINIFPHLYDSTLTDSKIIQTLNIIPKKFYFVLFKDDTAKYAATTRKLGTNYQFLFAYKNGNTKRIYSYNKKLQLSGGYGEYYENSKVKLSGGTYKKGKKHGKWKYYNQAGELVKTQKYKRDVVKNTKEYNPPKQTYFSTHPNTKANGMPYTIK